MQIKKYQQEIKKFISVKIVAFLLKKISFVYFGTIFKKMIPFFKDLFKDF